MFIPEVEITRETAEKISLADEEIEIRLALLLESLSAQTVKAVLQCLCYSNSVANRVVELVENKAVALETNPPAVKRLLNALGAENAKRLVRFRRADGSITQETEEDILCRINEIIDNNECYSLATLAVNGSDLSVVGIKGKRIGETLNKLLEEVIDGKVKNVKEELLEKVK